MNAARVDRASNRVVPGAQLGISSYDRYGIEAALRLKEARGGDVVAVTAGPAVARDVISRILARAGAITTPAASVREAVAAITSDRPDVIVSDIAMVGEDGYWLVRELKRLPADVLDDVPVIAATAYGTEHPRARVLAAGFAEHLKKPVDPEMLCRTVARLTTD